MTVSRRLLVLVVGWLAIVAVGSTLVWAVVAHTGRDVGEPEADTAAASSGTQPTFAASSPGQPTGSAQPSSTPTVSPSPTPTPTPTTTGGSDPSSSPDPTGGPHPSSSPDPTGGPHPSSTPDPTEDADPPATTAPPAQSHERTWQGDAGRVVASCTGAAISLVAAQPNNGWRVEVENPGPEELSVKFELTEEQEDDRIATRMSTEGLVEEVEVHASCSDGVPTFSEDS